MKGNSMTEEKEIYRKALLVFGINHQVAMAHGEMGELSAALTQYFTQRKIPIESVIEEIADVQIMCGQLQQHIIRACGYDAVESIKQEKLTKLLDEIKKQGVKL